MAACCTGRYQSFDGIPFGIILDGRSNSVRDWGGMEPIYSEEQVPYSNIVISEVMGYTPAQVTWRLTLCCRESYNAMLARLGVTGDLVLLANTQSLSGTQITRGVPGRVYEVLDNVRLRAIPVREHFTDGHKEVEATFDRAFDPVSRQAVVT